ncbi:hypothetical protein ScPMuIL_014671 [Solemya velum]
MQQSGYTRLEYGGIENPHTIYLFCLQILLQLKMDAVYQDKRFSHVVNDPRFRRISKEDRKVKIDKRFKPMFEDKRFKLKYTVDKRGRPVNTTTNENLKKFYELSDSSENSSDDEDGDEDEDEDENESENKEVIKGRAEKDLSTKNEHRAVGEKKQKRNIKLSSSDESGEEDVSDKDSAVHLSGAISGSEEDSEESGWLYSSDGELDRARGEGNVSSSSDDDDEDEDEQQEADTVHDWNQLDKDAPIVEDVSSRLAVCNMDWDRIKADDLFALMHSFKPAIGFVKSVKIYPSEFGLRRMAEERVAGPQELKAPGGSQDKTRHDTKDVEGGSYHREKLRQYQLNRMKYYYAVVECDSGDTASHIYTECDGIEYESSATRLDLRFIPDGMTFDQAPESSCTGMPDSSLYKPSQFYTTALGQSKVDLTWDETDRERVSKLTSKVKVTKDDIKEADFQAYLASSSSEEDENTERGEVGEVGDSDESDEEEQESSRLEKYKKLIQELGDTTEKNEQTHKEMEVTWEPGLRETTEEIVKKKKKSKDMSVWDEYLHKKAEKKRKKREEKTIQESKSEQRSSPEEAADTVAFSDDDIPAGIDMGDSFFSDEIKANQKQVKKKKKKGKRRKEELTAEELEVQEKEKAQLSMLMEADNKQHYNLKDLLVEAKKKKKKKKRKREEPNQVEDDFKMNTTDPRFSEIYKSSLFHIDPSAPEFKRTKAMESVIEEKMRRVENSKDGIITAKKDSKKNVQGITVAEEGISKTETDSERKKRKKQSSHNGDNSKSQRSEPKNRDRTLDPSLASLVKSVKAKTQQFKAKHKS